MTYSPSDAARMTQDGRRRTIGHVVDCDGRKAVVMAQVDDDVEYLQNYWAVGQLISIWEGKNRVVGQSFKVESDGSRWSEEGVNTLLIHIELVGEIHEKDGGASSFSSGITSYPRMGAVAHRIRMSDLEAIYKNDADNTIKVGTLTQESSIDAKIDLEKLMSRHFAVVGSTGVGKSTSVTLILRKIIAKRKDIRVLILDPHNEFTAAFPNDSVVKDSSTLALPFWLFMFAEFTEVVFRGQKGVEAETELLRDMIAEAKERYTEMPAGTVSRRTLSKAGYTADSPVPYRLVDLFQVIDERLGQLDGKSEKPVIKALRDRLTAITKDPRFSFMFGANAAGGDRLAEIISDIFRVPHNDKQISIVDLSGIPSEVVNSVASVLCRMAFDLAVWSQGGVQTLVVCEEAHRYIPADEGTGFWPTRQAIARIAKEGRKYGVYLGIITQRPSELDPTILSQCNTVFTMRLSNQADQKIIAGAMTNGAQSSINFISSIANRECIAFGEALKTPMRFTFETIDKKDLPGSHIYEMQEAVRNGLEVDILAVIRKMREAESRKKSGDEPAVATLGEPVAAQRGEPGPAQFNPNRLQPVSAPPANHWDRDSDRPIEPGSVRQAAASAIPLRPASTSYRTAPEPAPMQTPAPQRASGGANSLISAFRSKN